MFNIQGVYWVEKVHIMLSIIIILMQNELLVIGCYIGVDRMYTQSEYMNFQKQVIINSCHKKDKIPYTHCIQYEVSSAWLTLQLETKLSKRKPCQIVAS